MNIGIIELIFIFLVFCLVWFIIFKVSLIAGKKKSAKNLVKKLEKQDKKFFAEGKEIDIKKDLMLALSKNKEKKKNEKRRDKKKDK